MVSMPTFGKVKTCILAGTKYIHKAIVVHVFCKITITLCASSACMCRNLDQLALGRLPVEEYKL